MAIGEQSVSPHETPATVAIDAHYATIGIIPGWQRARALRLSQWLRSTPYELGKLVAVDFETMGTCLQRNFFPPHITLHLATLELWYYENIKGRNCSPLIPMDKFKPHVVNRPVVPSNDSK